MTKEDLYELRKVFFNLTDEERIARDLYLKKFYDGTMSGPLVDDVYISKPGVTILNDEPISEFNVEENPFLILERKINEKGLSDKKILFTMDGKSKTYGQLYEETKKIALGFKKQGLKNGDTIACIFLNSIDEASVLFAALALGIKIKYIDFTKGLGAVKKYFNETEINAVVMDDMFKMIIPFIYKKNIPYIVADNNKEYSILNIYSLKKFMRTSDGKITVESNKNNPVLIATPVV